MLDRSIPSLGRHRTLKPTNRKPSFLQPKRNQIQKVDKLAEHDALRRSILQPEVAQLFHKSLNLRRGSPIVQIQPTEDTLPSRDSALFNLHRRCFQVDRQG